jgi:hypothetical protein
MDEFANAMMQSVSNLSGRRQQAFCYMPRSIVPQSLFARPEGHAMDRNAKP